MKDHIIQEYLREACMTRMSLTIQRLFIPIMVYYERTRIRGLLDEFFLTMTEDCPSSSSFDNDFAFNYVLQEINRLLKQSGKNIGEVDLSQRTIKVDD